MAVFNDAVLDGHLIAPDSYAVPIVILGSLAGRCKENGVSFRSCGDQDTSVHENFDSRSVMAVHLNVESRIALDPCTRLNGQFTRFGYGHIP